MTPMFGGQSCRALTCLAGTLLVLAVAACGGSSSAMAEVGDCIDTGNEVVDCSSANATKRLVSSQSGSSAIACVQIGAKPQVQVKVGDATFCAEDK